MGTINDRINELVEVFCNNNNSTFANKIGVSEANVRNYRNGTEPKFSVIEKIARNFEINYEWLIKGEGNLKKDDNIKIIRGNRKTTDALRETQEIPLYDLEATAGLVELMKGGEAAHLLDTIKIPNIPTCDGAISVTGDSMYPLLKSGDIILYKEVPVEEQSIFYGEMYLLGVRIDEYEEMITVKYVQKSEKGDGYITLVSQNKHHQPKDIPLNSVTAMAMVKVSIRSNTMF